MNPNLEEAPVISSYPIKEEESKTVPYCQKREVPVGRRLVTRRWLIFCVLIVAFVIIAFLIILCGIFFSQLRNQNNYTIPSNPPVAAQIQSPQIGISPGFMLMSPQYIYTMAFTNSLQLFTTTTLGGRIIWSSPVSVSGAGSQYPPPSSSSSKEKKIEIREIEEKSERKKETSTSPRKVWIDTNALVADLNSDYLTNYIHFKTSMENDSPHHGGKAIREKRNCNSSSNSSNSCDFKNNNHHNNNIQTSEYNINRSLNFTSEGILYIEDTETKTVVWRSSNVTNVTGTYFLRVLDAGVLQIVNNSNTVIWQVDNFTPSALKTLSSFPGGRSIGNGITLKNDSYIFDFESNNGQFTIRKKFSLEVLWSSPSPAKFLNETSANSLFYAIYTIYGNLMIFNENRDTIWSTNTASIINVPNSGHPDFISFYQLNLNPNGVLQLEYKNISYFITSTNKSNANFRTPSLPFSISSPFQILINPSSSQIITQSSDERTQFVFETDGSLSLYELQISGEKKSLSSTRPLTGDLLVLHGIESFLSSSSSTSSSSEINSNTSTNIDTNGSGFVGCLALYKTGDSIPVWKFCPSTPLSNVAIQLPVTLCFNTGNRLSLLSNDQQILISQNIL